jgi:mitochondrial inner membrane protein COX18
MAAPLGAARRTTPSILPNTKPPYLTASLLLRLPPPYRAFHASPQPHFILESLLTSTHSLLTGIHNVTHLPWAFTIPLSALLIRLTLTLPITLHNRHAIQQRLDLQPLVAAWSHEIRRANHRKIGHLEPARFIRYTEQDIRAKRNEIYKRWGCGQWKNFLSLVQLPIWLLMVETLREICGTHKGILGLFMPSAAARQNDLEAAPELAAAGVAEAGVGAELVSDSIVEAVVPVEPTLASEGMLWFTDLTAPDPLLLLPFMLSGTMFLNIYSGQKRGVPGVMLTPGRRRIMRALGLVALVAGPLTLQMPTAMLLYWMSSGVMGYVQGLLIDVYMPIRPPVRPCGPRMGVIWEPENGSTKKLRSVAS